MTSVPESQNVPRLVFTLGREPHILTFTLDKGQVWTLGRSFENQIVIDDASISRKHAMLQRLENGDIYLVDLGSSNGTLVNERRVGVPVTLRTGDRITFGKTECQFTVPDAQPRTTPEFSQTAAGSSTQILQERRLLTVTVIDVRGFTALTRQISEQVLSGVMGYWFQHASRITQQSGGWIDRYIGDAIMALWSHDEDDPAASRYAERWVWAIAEISLMTAKVAQHFPLTTPLRVGAGVNTGFAVMTNTGSRDRPEYTAIGDTVNIAFRLEAATRTIDRDLLIGETAFKELEKLGVAGCFTRVEVALKGYEGQTPAYTADFADVVEIAQRLSDATTRLRRTPRP